MRDESRRAKIIKDEEKGEENSCKSSLFSLRGREEKVEKEEEGSSTRERCASLVGR